MERRQVNSDNQPRRMPPPLARVRTPLREVRAPARPPAAQPREVAPGRRPANPSAINAVLGAWLMVSAFLWPHAQASFANTLIVGALLAAYGLFAHRPMARMTCAALGVWLMLSTVSIVPRNELTLWHNLVLGLAALVIAFLPQPRPRLRAVK